MKWRSLDESISQPDSRSLREIYAQRKALIAKYVPAEIQAIHARVVDELRHSGIADRSLRAGSEAPEFQLTDHNGRVIRSSELLDKGRLVVCFFRGRWCPFCVGQAEIMNAVVPQLRELGTSLVAVSPQTVHQSYLMADQHHMRFPLLSDVGNNIARQFGLVYQVPEYQQDVYRRAFVNLPFVNGDSSWELPIPAVYILDKQRSADRASLPREKQRLGMPAKREILHAYSNPDYTERPEPAEVVQFLSQLSR